MRQIIPVRIHLSDLPFAFVVVLVVAVADVVIVVLLVIVIVSQTSMYRLYRRSLFDLL